MGTRTLDSNRESIWVPESMGDHHNEKSVAIFLMFPEDEKVHGSSRWFRKSPPEAILECKTKKLRNKEIDLVLVRWKHSLGPNLTWETKDEMMKRYPGFVDYEKIPRTESS
ncbi:hypothetical protein LXL04_035562 [Taraxacum kok-saghyz]